MRDFKKTVAWFTVVSVSAVSLCDSPNFAAPQKNSSCTASKIVEESCADASWVNVERAKPFVAERMLKSFKSSVQIEERTELVARDAAGRIRQEDHISLSGMSGMFGSPHPIVALGGVASSNRDLNLGTQPDDASDTSNPSATGKEELFVSILDCFAGKRIQLTPSTQTAIVNQSCGNVTNFRPNDQPYSYKFSQFIKANTQPDVTVDDLGYKDINGMQARGIKISWGGSEKDSAWKGRAVRVWEEWVSDDLGLTLVWVYSDLVKGIENRVTLRNIRHEEPDASLFLVPSEYKIEYWK